MKPTTKSSIPLAFIRFSAAVVLFLAVVQTISTYLTNARNNSLYRFWRTEISSDGRVTYIAERGNLAVGRILDTWYFDETLQHPQKEHRIIGGFLTNLTTSVMRNSAKNVERYSHTATPLDLSSSAVLYNKNNRELNNRTVIWWNGPAGQVDWYDGPSRMRVASLGPVGPPVKAPSRPKERFDLTSLNLFKYGYIPTPGGIYDISEALDESSAKLVYKGSYEALVLMGGRRIPMAKLLVVHGNTLSVFDETGLLIRDTKLPDIAVSLFHNSFDINMFDNGRLAFNGYRKIYNEKTILLLAEDGSLLRRVDYNTEEIEKAMNGGVHRTATLAFPTLMPPIPVPGLMETAALVQSIALSFILAAAILWHQRRTGRRGMRCAAWAIFVFVFGLLGFLTYLVAYRDRRCELCPKCNRPRFITEEFCPHCRAPWPAPGLLGIEIIDSASITAIWQGEGAS